MPLSYTDTHTHTCTYTHTHTHTHTYTDTHADSLVSVLCDLYLSWSSVALCSAGDIDRVTKQTIAWHTATNNTSNNWSTVYTYSHLYRGGGREGERERGREGGRRGERGRGGEGGRDGMLIYTGQEHVHMYISAHAHK